MFMISLYAIFFGFFGCSGGLNYDMVVVRFLVLMFLMSFMRFGLEELLMLMLFVILFMMYCFGKNLCLFGLWMGINVVAVILYFFVLFC